MAYGQNVKSDKTEPLVSDAPGQPPLVIVEVHELPWAVLDLFTRQHPDACLTRLRSHAQVFRLQNQDADLRFWSSSASLHRGVPLQVHQLRFLNQPDPMVHPPFWVNLAKAGISVGVFNSQFSRSWAEVAGPFLKFLVPDPFSHEDWAQPESLRNTVHVQRGLARIHDLSYHPWRAQMARVGLALGYIWRHVTQIPRAPEPQVTLLWGRLFEKLKGRQPSLIGLRLAFYTWWLQWQEHRPAMAIFSTSVVATAMHQEMGSVRLQDGVAPALPRRIDKAMQSLDRKLALLCQALDRDGGALVLVSAFGQGMRDNPRHEQHMLFGVFRHPDKLLVWLDLVQDGMVMPAMSPQITLHFQTQQACALALCRLGRLRRFTDRAPLLDVETEPSGLSLSVTPKVEDGGWTRGLMWVQDLQSDGALAPDSRAGHAWPMKRIGLRAQRTQWQSGQHTPEGVMVVYPANLGCGTAPNAQTFEDGSLPVMAVPQWAPTVKAFFGLPPQGQVHPGFLAALQEAGRRRTPTP